MNARPEWQERLEEPETTSPPEGLLPKLIEDIPTSSELRAATTEDADQAGRGAGSSGRPWLVAATLLLASVPAFLLWQKQVDPQSQQLSVYSTERVASGPPSIVAPEPFRPPALPDPSPGEAAALPSANQSRTEERRAESVLQSIVPRDSRVADGNAERSLGFDEGFESSDVGSNAPPASEPAPNELIRRQKELIRRQGNPGPGRARISEEITVTSEVPIVEQHHVSSGTVVGEYSGVESRRATRYDYDLAPAEPDTMIFDRERPHRFVDPADEPLSTFGLDVDTGSYTLARRYLLDVGTLPPADSIRIEEWVNYFDYGDPGPGTRGRDDFRITVEGAPNPYSASSRRYLVRVGIKAREVRPRKREPVSLIFLVDVSGSMARENRLELVKRSLELLLDELNEDDRVGLVVYSSRAREILEPTSNRDRVLRALERLEPEQSTNLEAGMELAYAMAERHARRGVVSRIVLCSDGVANVGSTDPIELLESVAESAEAGIELATVGFGMGNYNDALMEQLANRGDGSYAYVDTLDEARRVFVENLTGMLYTVASDAQVQVEFNPDTVVRYRQLGYENRELPPEAFRDPATDAGEIGAGHSISVLYEIELLRGASDVDRLAELRLRYRSKETKRFEETAVEIRKRDLATSWRRAEDGLRLAGAVASVADLLRQVDGSDLRSASRTEIEEMSEVFDLAQRELRQLEGFGGNEVQEFEEMVHRVYRRIRVAQD